MKSWLKVFFGKNKNPLWRSVYVFYRFLIRQRCVFVAHIPCVFELFLSKHSVDGHPGRGGITKFIRCQNEESFDALHDIVQIEIIFSDFLFDFLFSDLFQSLFGDVIMNVVVFVPFHIFVVNVF